LLFRDLIIYNVNDTSDLIYHFNNFEKQK